MIAIVTKYPARREKFDDLLAFVTNLVKDKDKIRIGCSESHLYASPNRDEIQVASIWESLEYYERYVDELVSRFAVLDLQSELLRDEVRIEVYDTLDAGMINQVPLRSERHQPHA
ncbi:hypothetical protein [Tritonibacter horizontis]|uniref:ABM domain-containing protein n=1 Tax=Tritonibacter horizontis TaxID=1768241 RepID=A0A132BTP7_9RHOB|nr:hypothetical protein [Tritonibacter horizontis]KUP91765.1 hypothetical protein TRIHO_34270 [Tritonibacter horizontis]